MTLSVHDKWLLGISTSGRQYLIHTRTPRFTCELFGEDDTAGILAPFSYGLEDGRTLANFVFNDEPPHGERLRDLLQSAENQLLAVLGE